VSGGGGTITVIDGKTNTVLEEFDIPPPPGAHLPGTTSPAENGLPGGLAFDPETGYLWVANTGEVGGEDCCTVPGKLSVYDTKTKQWLRGGADGIPAGITPIQPVIDKRTNRVYVASIHTNEVTVVNSHTLNPVTQIEVLPEPYDVAVDPRRHRLYIGHFDSRAASETEPLQPWRTVLEVLDTETNKLLRPVYAGAGRFTRQLDLNPLTGRVYVNNLAAATLTILGPRLKFRQRLGVGIGPRGVAVNPLTNKVYVGNASQSVGSLTGGPGLDGLPDTITVIRDPARRPKGR
jgi:YVTN family beta-propeller protein